MNTGPTRLEPRGPAPAKKTVTPKIGQQISGKTKFTLQNNKISNQRKPESKLEVSPKGQNSKPTISSQSKIATQMKNSKLVVTSKNPVEEVPKKDILNPVKQITYNRTKVSNSDSIKPTSPKGSAVSRVQEKSMPNVRNKATVPLVKTVKATRISLSAKQPVKSPQKIEKTDNADAPAPEMELTRKQSSESIPKKSETPKKSRKREGSAEVVPEMTPFKKASVTNSKKQSSLESMASRSSRKSKILPSKPVTPLRKHSVEKHRCVNRSTNKVEKPRPISGRSDKNEKTSMISQDNDEVKKPESISGRSGEIENPPVISQANDEVIKPRSISGKSGKVENPPVISRDNDKVEKPRPISRSSGSAEKTRPSSQKSGKSIVNSDFKKTIPSKVVPDPAKKESGEKISSSNSQKTQKSMEKIAEQNLQKKTPSLEKKQNSSEKIRGVSQSGQRKRSTEKVVESSQSRPFTSELAQRKQVTIEKPKVQNNMESVPENTRVKSPKISIAGRDRNVTISQPDISFSGRKVFKNISKDTLSVKNLIASRIASSLSIKPSSDSVASVRRVKPSNAAQALTFDFYKRYKYVAFVGQIEQDTSSLASEITLYQPPENELLLYDAANCAATQAYLKICGLNFTVAHKSNAEQMSPSGKVPFIRCGSCIISEFEPISSFITSKTDAGINKDPEDATMKAFMAMVSGMLENAERYVCWYDETTLTEHTNPRNGARYPFPLNYILNLKKKSEERRCLVAHGTSYKTMEQILRDVDTCLKHLSQRLGNNKVFFGKKYCEIDALVYGHVYALSNIKLSGHARRLEQIVKNHPNLISFAKDMDDYLKLKKFEPDNLSEVFQWKKDAVDISPITDYKKAELVC